MNFNNNTIIPIKGDASFRKFYRKKNKKKSSIIIYSQKEKIKNLLNYDSINKLLLNNKISGPILLSENFNQNYIEIEDLGTNDIPNPISTMLLIESTLSTLISIFGVIPA